MAFPWTQEAESALEGLCADGLAYSKIADELSARFRATVSRNACIGKAKRMGLSEGKPAATIRTRSPRRARVNGARKQAPRKPRLGFVFGPGNGRPCDPGPTDLPPDESPFAVTIYQLADGHCRWPLGNPSAGMLYCGALAEIAAGRGPDGEPKTLPYCTRHCAIAYVRRDPETGARL